MVKLFIAIATSAAFDTGRGKALDRLRDQLGIKGLLWKRDADAGVEFYVHQDREAKGSLGPWLECMKRACESDATHFVFLPDDAIVVPHFVDVMRNVLAAQPYAIVCCQSQHPKAPDAYASGARLYATPDGFTAFGGAMPIDFARVHLRWRAEKLRPGALVQGDEGVNLHAMWAGMPILKPLPSLVQHDVSLPSLDGNDHHAELSPRTSLVWEPDADLRGVDWDEPAFDIGRTYAGNHWRLAFDLRPEAWQLDGMYELERERPVGNVPHVFIATPAYSGPKLGYLRSVRATVEDLQRHGIQVTHHLTSGDSLVTRGRHVLMHHFLCSGATHFLQWDADVECLDPTAVRAMLATGHDVIGGAYPWRDGSGRCVANPLRTSFATQQIEYEDGCVRVADIGTGFLLTSRRVLYDLMHLHPELLYQSDSPDLASVALWALFDVCLETMPNGRRRYASEDWHFCTLVREMGGSVWCYLPPRFVHWGETGHGGHLLDAWKMSFPDEKTEAATDAP